MEQVGYSLIDSSGKELQYWGDTKGQCAGSPDCITLSNGDFVHCAGLNEVLSDGSRLVTRWMDDSPPSKWYASTGTALSFDGAKIIVTVQYEAIPSIVPKVVSKLAFRDAAISSGDWSAIKSAIAADPDASEVWSLASDVNRAHPVVAKIGAALGKTSQQIDDLFRAAVG